MKITRKNLLDYPYIPKVIEIDKKKLQKLKDNPPVAEHGKVIGSNHVFPYQLRSFTVSGPNLVDKKEWEMKVRYLEVKLSSEIRLFGFIKTEIDTRLATIGSARDKVAMEYILQGMTQEEVGDKLFLSQSAISKTIGKFVDDNEVE